MCQMCPEKVKYLFVKNVGKKDAAKKSGHWQKQQSSPTDAGSIIKNP